MDLCMNVTKYGIVRFIAVLGLAGELGAGNYSGGGMGLLLLLLRVGVFESGLFHNMNSANVQKGQLRMLFNNTARFKRYLYCMCIGLPIWFVVGVAGYTVAAKSARHWGPGRIECGKRGYVYLFRNITWRLYRRPVSSMA
ncbi:hypothetical protein FQR65_LT15204 [Abscondita terminalis]|nr:hypothetical protein FQR65_LT15204 [Abscondita terminalis]